MSVKFNLSGVVLRGAAIAQRKNYGGQLDALHLESNQANILPFDIRLPARTTMAEMARHGAVAWLRRVTGRMNADGGVDFQHYQLNIRESVKPCARTAQVVIERVYEDLLPLDEYPAGFVMPDAPGLPTIDDPIIVSSHTLDGGGWYTYKIYCEVLEC